MATEENQTNETAQEDYKQGVLDRTKKPVEDMPDALRNNQHEVHDVIGGLKGLSGSSGTWRYRGDRKDLSAFLC